MRFIALLVCLCFTLNVLASTETIQELERSMDEYQYSLSVDWDQKDQAFYEASTKAFFVKMKTLIQDQGLSPEQVLNLVESKTKNKAALEAVKLKLSLLSKNASEEDLIAILKDSSRDLYTQGASWNGQVVLQYAAASMIVGVVLYAIYWSATHECVASETKYVCNSAANQNCFYTGGNLGGYGYDRWGNYVQAGYTCYGPPQTHCGFRDVCTQYAEK